jgi:hypothetical protein
VLKCSSLLPLEEGNAKERTSEPPSSVLDLPYDLVKVGQFFLYKRKVRTYNTCKKLGYLKSKCLTLDALVICCSCSYLGYYKKDCLNRIYTNYGKLPYKNNLDYSNPRIYSCCSKLGYI